MKKILLFAMMCLFGLFSTISAQNVISLDGADVKTATSNEVRSSSDHCYVNFTLYDAASDGWHGGYLRVYFDNIYEDLIIDNGPSFTLEIPRNSYVYVVFYEGSNWADECSYEIAYEDGPIIHEASYYNDNMNFDFYVNCESIYEEGTKVIGEGDLTVSSLPTNAIITIL